jgi:hypothetical protein
MQNAIAVDKENLMNKPEKHKMCQPQHFTVLHSERGGNQTCGKMLGFSAFTVFIRSNNTGASLNAKNPAIYGSVRVTGCNFE